MYTVGVINEAWELLARTTEDGRDVALVARVRHPDHERVTMWKLVRYADGWRSVGQWISKGCYRKFPEARGVKLSHSRTDQILLKLAEGA